MIPFVGTAVNFAAVLIAGLLGSCLKRGIPKRFSESVVYAVTICVLYIGIEGALEAPPVLSDTAFFSPGLVKILIMVISMGIGTLIGELLDLEGLLNRFGAFIERKLSFLNTENTSVARGFVSCSLLFGVGAMAINGAIMDGMGQPDLLLAKAIIDGIMCFTMATTLGIGCACSAVVVLFYEGGVALLALFFSSFLPAASLSYMSIVGSLIIIFVGTNSIGITKARTANMVPAMFVPLLLVPLFQLIL